MDGAWAKTAEEVLRHFSVNHLTGLSSRQAAEHAERYGKNGEYIRTHSVQAVSCSLHRVQSYQRSHRPRCGN
jgi:hypothetical protein